MSFATKGMTQEQVMIDQARTLDAMTADLLRAATVKGAATGAVAGCGLALVSASDSVNCVTGALTGGTIGALVGNAMGRKQVEERVEVVSLSRVTPALSGAQREMARVNDGLSTFLADQDAELAELKQQRDAGVLSFADYDARLTEVRDSRAEIAQALNLSADQARAAKRALMAAGDKGQTGLDWHIMSAETLEDEAVSARSRITLL